MATLIPTLNLTTVMTPDIAHPSKGTHAKSTENYLYRNQITQVFIRFEVSNFIALALDRLKEMELTNNVDDFEIPDVTFDNARNTIFELSPFLEFLDPDEIGPSSYDTILCNFEIEDKSLLLDIGMESIAYVFSDQSDQIRSKESDFEDEEFWSEINHLFNSKFKNG